MPYRGRFAPSPTGPLHFGSLVAALASYLDARAHLGDWLIRIEDIDPLRDKPDHAHRIIASLEAHGFDWDEPIRWQSRHFGLYHQRLQELLRSGHAYACPCSRKELRANGGRHAHQCREQKLPTDSGPTAFRFALETRDWQWQDLLLGPQCMAVRAEADDFVLQRKEGFFAYQLAVVSDDIEQGITHVVRGSDLLDSTPFQLALYHALAATPPAFLHLPVVTDSQGQKLSKQAHAPALDDSTPGANLRDAFVALRHPLPPDIADASPAAQLDWGKSHWQRQRVPAVLALRQGAYKADS